MQLPKLVLARVRAQKHKLLEEHKCNLAEQHKCKLAEQNKWQAYMQAKLTTVMLAWPRMCLCSAMQFCQQDGTMRQTEAACPVHKDKPNKGILYCFEQLRKYLVNCIMYAEVPAQTVEGKKGRSLVTGQYISGPDLFFDFVAVSCVSKLCAAIEVCAQEHKRKEKRPLRDVKKADFAAEVGLPVTWLYLRSDGKPEYAEWQKKLQMLAHWMTGE